MGKARHISLAWVVATALLLASSVMLVGCGCSRSPEGEVTQDEAQPASNDRQAGNAPSGTPATTESPVGDADTTTEVMDDGDGTDTGDTQLSPAAKRVMEDIPRVSQLPSGRNADEVRAAIAKYVTESYDGDSPTDIELLGSGSAPSQQTLGEEDYWASYVVTLASHGRIGLRVICSGSIDPYVTETDVLPVSDGLVYRVSDGSYDPVFVQNIDDGDATIVSQEFQGNLLSSNDSE